MSSILVLFVVYGTLFLILFTIAWRFRTTENYVADNIMDILDIQKNLMKKTLCENKKEVLDFLNSQHDPNIDMPIRYDADTKKYSLHPLICSS